MARVFITGSTGFVGCYLLTELIEKTDIKDFILLVRDREKAKEKLALSIKKASNKGKKIEFVTGDVSKKNFGLSDQELELVKNSEEVYHLASNVSLSRKWRDRRNIFQSNLEGTKNLLEIFKDSSKLKQIYHFSSAYACGKTQEIVKEDWIKKPARFRNPYEESKWLSEELIKDYTEKFNIPAVILRPTIVIAANKEQFRDMRYQTIYLFSRILKKAFDYNHEKPIRIKGKYSDFLNITPVGDIIKILLEIRKSKNKKKIYNLCCSKNLSTRLFLEGIEQGIGFKNGFPVVEKIIKPTRIERVLNKRIDVFIVYNLDDYLKWDVSNTLKIRKKLKIKERDNKWLRNHIKEYMGFLKELKLKSK